MDTSLYESPDVDLIGESDAFLHVLRLVERIARCDATVLVQGETGTGKEVVARAIHYLSGRHAFPFIPVNCGALPDNLVENELFGHVRGAFTDAKGAQTGLVAHAEKGTLLLDEIECLSPKGQVVLLRFLQDQCYRPLGGQQQLCANVRIIAASNCSLQDLARNGDFRQDLLYRLAIMCVTLPPLRQRGRDVILLAQHFIHAFTRRYRLEERKLDAACVDSLLGYSWPGNVRELENIIHRELLLTESWTLRLRPGLPLEAPDDGAHLSPPASGEWHYDLGFSRAKARVIADFERAFVTRALAESGGNVSLAARKAGKERRAFGKLMKKHGIRRSGYPVFSPGQGAGTGPGRAAARKES